MEIDLESLKEETYLVDREAHPKIEDVIVVFRIEDRLVLAQEDGTKYVISGIDHYVPGIPRASDQLEGLKVFGYDLATISVDTIRSEWVGTVI